MSNKVLINIIVPSVNAQYEVYIPINETIGKIYHILSKAINELSDSNYKMDADHYLLDPDNGTIYPENEMVRNTNIKNSKKVILI